MNTNYDLSKPKRYLKSNHACLNADFHVIGVLIHS